MNINKTTLYTITTLQAWLIFTLPQKQIFHITSLFIALYFTFVLIVHFFVLKNSTLINAQSEFLPDEIKEKARELEELIKKHFHKK